MQAVTPGRAKTAHHQDAVIVRRSKQDEMRAQERWKTSTALRVEKPTAEDPRGHRFLPWVVRHLGWRCGRRMHLVKITGVFQGRCWCGPRAHREAPSDPRLLDQGPCLSSLQVHALHCTKARGSVPRAHGKSMRARL